MSTRFAVVVSLALAALTLVAGQETAPARAAAKCPAYVFIGARGSGESSKSMGSAVEAEWKTLKQILGDSVEISAINVNYDAVAVVHDYRVLSHKVTFLDFQSPAYLSSVAGGAGAVAGLVSRCKTSRIILAGHSQGAHAIMRAMPALDHRRIVAVTLFGNPMFHANSYAARGDFDPTRNGLAALPRLSPYPNGLKGRFFDYCHAHDPVCQGFVHCFRSGPLSVRCDSDFNAHTHSTYPGQDTEAAAANVARLIRDDQAARGHVIPEPLPASKGPVDVVFAIDTTGSMEPIINSVSTDVQAMAGQLATTEPDYRLALVAYRDGPPACDDEYQAQTVQDFTSDTTAFNNAVGALTADGGCDDDESVYTGAMQGLTLTWRPSSTKVLIVIGDAAGHSPDPGTGYVAGDVIERAQASSVAIYGLDGGVAASTLTELADATGGQVFSTDHANQVPGAIEQAISAQAAAPSADAGGGGGARMAMAHTAADANATYVAPVGAPVTVSAANSWSPLGRALRYGWDFDGDGVIDLTSEVPVVTHTWVGPYAGEITLHVTDSAGQTAVTRTHVIAAGKPVDAPARPRKPSLTLKGRVATATWKPGRGGGRTGIWVVRSSRGVIIGYVAAKHGSRPRFTLKRLPRGQLFRIRVTAFNAAGESAQSPMSAAVRLTRRR
jgi:hypothetical protein